MLRKRWLGILVGALLAAGSSVQAAAVQGDPQIKSIEAISFGPNGLLLVGDSKGAQVVAIELVCAAQATPPGAPHVDSLHSCARCR